MPASFRPIFKIVIVIETSPWLNEIPIESRVGHLRFSEKISPKHQQSAREPKRIKFNIHVSNISVSFMFVSGNIHDKNILSKPNINII